MTKRPVNNTLLLERVRKTGYRICISNSRCDRLRYGAKWPSHHTKSNPRQKHWGASAFEVALCLKYLATAPQPFPRSLPRSTRPGGHLPLTVALAVNWLKLLSPLIPLPHQAVKSKLQVDLTSIFHFLTVSFCISRSKNVRYCHLSSDGENIFVRHDLKKELNQSQHFFLSHNQRHSVCSMFLCLLCVTHLTTSYLRATDLIMHSALGKTACTWVHSKHSKLLQVAKQ